MLISLSNGEIIEVVKTNFTNDKMYYEYIMTLFLLNNTK